MNRIKRNAFHGKINTVCARQGSHSQNIELFVGGLAPHIEEECLIEFFSAFGQVVDSRIMRYRDGKSRGFAFLRFKEQGVAEYLARIQNLSIRGKSVQVKVALSRYESLLLSTDEFSRKIYIKNLPDEFNELQLKELFSSFGNIESCTISINAESGRSRRFGFVIFSSIESASNALKLNRKVMLGRNLLQIRPAVPRFQLEDMKTLEPNAVYDQINERLVKDDHPGYIFRLSLELGSKACRKYNSILQTRRRETSCGLVAVGKSTHSTSNFPSSEISLNTSPEGVT